jgi:hypothetical protein
VRHAICGHCAGQATEISGQFGEVYVAMRIYKQCNFNMLNITANVVYR